MFEIYIVAIIIYIYVYIHVAHIYTTPCDTFIYYYVQGNSTGELTMTSIKRTTRLPLSKARRDILTNDVGVSVDYYPAKDTTDNHCRWVCTDADCEQCGTGFKTFPAFMKHLRVHHDLEFCLLPISVWRRQKYIRT